MTAGEIPPKNVTGASLNREVLIKFLQNLSSQAVKYFKLRSTKVINLLETTAPMNVFITVPV